MPVTLEQLLIYECEMEGCEFMGRRAARAGRDTSACRFKAGTDRYDAWMQGYNDEKAGKYDRANRPR